MEEWAGEGTSVPDERATAASVSDGASDSAGQSSTVRSAPTSDWESAGQSSTSRSEPTGRSAPASRSESDEPFPTARSVPAFRAAKASSAGPSESSAFSNKKCTPRPPRHKKRQAAARAHKPEPQTKQPADRYHRETEAAPEHWTDWKSSDVSILPNRCSESSVGIGKSASGRGQPVLA